MKKERIVFEDDIQPPKPPEKPPIKKTKK